MSIIIIIVCEITFIIIGGELKYRYEKKKEELINNAKEKHILSPFFSSILIENEMKKML